MNLQGESLTLSFDDAISAYFGAVKRKDQPLALALSDLLNQTMYQEDDALAKSTGYPDLDDTDQNDELIDSDICPDVCLDCDPELELRIVKAIQVGSQQIKEYSKEFDEGLQPKFPVEQVMSEKLAFVQKGHLIMILCE